MPIVFLNSRKYTQGPGGIGGIDPPAVGDFVFPITGNPWPYYLTMVALIVVTMILVYRLQDSRLGRSWMAIREDELAASASGINTVDHEAPGVRPGRVDGRRGRRLLRQQADARESRRCSASRSRSRSWPWSSSAAWATSGAWRVGAFILFEIQTVLLKQLNLFFDNIGELPIVGDLFANIDFIQYQFLLYGIALVAMMLLRPEGLFPSRRRRRELHAEEDADFAEHGDAMGAAPE